MNCSVKIAVYQATTGIDPAVNAERLVDAIEKASEGGAAMLFTPEMSGMLDRNRKRAAANIAREEDDAVLASVREAAARCGIWVALGSLAVEREDGRWANRSILVDPNGAIAARYDKMHMFDVELDTGESWRESNAYAAGDDVVSAQTPLGTLGFAICYDLRFPALFEALGELGSDAIAIPAAFTVPTGRDHWAVMLRARAIEASAFVIAAAQGGKHEDGRETYGHSMVIDPWGKVLLDMGEGGDRIAFAEIDPARVIEVRKQVPSLANRRKIPSPRS